MNDLKIHIKQQIVSSNSSVESIAFISDLHFDFINGEFCKKEDYKIKNSFVKFLIENFSHSIICILGDCFNNYRKTLSFIKELEKKKVKGFFVLGNHDFWNDKTKSIEEIVRLFEDYTKDFKYFRLLITGRKYYIDELCFIGDTGWTSFKQMGKKVDLFQFDNLPDSTYIKDFSPQNIISKHDKWIEFANEVLESEQKVIILTHFPMINFSKKPEKCWWSSDTELLETKNCWKIFGHTHNDKQKRKNNISAQRGYGNINFSELKRYGLNQYCTNDFGMLIKVKDLSKDIMLNVQPLLPFYSSVVINNPDTEIELIEEIKHRGFKRCSKNKEVFAELATDPYQYLKKVKNCMRDYIRNNYIGYKVVNGLSEKSVYAIFTAIECLERIFNVNDFSNPQIFVMSAIITGYVYYDMPWELENMRPVDNYDIVRFYLVFQTMKQFHLGFDDIKNIKKHYSRSIQFSNLNVCLPSVNNCCLTNDEALNYLKSTPLLD